MKAVVFDLDGTLYDSTGLPKRLIRANLLRVLTLGAERSARKILAGRQFVSEEDFYACFFSTIKSCKHGIPASTENIRKWYTGKYMPSMVAVLAKHYCARKGAAELVADLRKAGVKVAVYSDYGFVPEKLHALGLDSSMFDLVADAPSFGGIKPSAEGFKEVCKALGCAEEDAVMVGDREDTDGAGAAAAGMKFIKVNKDGSNWEEMANELSIR